ncbi:MAG: hypothetical protein HN576_03955 [Bacteriovoracaceae bacterium]|jgi:glutathione synthase/RimK-type ligase-like ATP-grasp enzyme|nr:hypothetical protein [Bacteriovoracaceae bacterium]
MDLLLITNDFKVPTFKRLIEECKNLSIGIKTLNPELITQRMPFTMHSDKVLNRFTSVNGYDLDLQLLSRGDQSKYINRIKGIQIARSKLTQSSYFSHANLPTISTLFIQGAVNFEIVTSFLQNYGQCFLSKPIRGNGGRGITFFDSHKSLLSYLETCQVMKDQRFIIQPFIESKKELRILMVNHEPFIAINKTSPLKGPEFRRNLSRINQLELEDISKLDTNLLTSCKSICKDLELRLCAIDLMQDKSGEYLFLEINSVPGWAYMEEFLDLKKRNLTREILEHIVE